MAKRIVRLIHFTLAKPDGTRVPKTTVNWVDDEGRPRMSLLEGTVSSVDALYMVGTVV